MNELYYRNKVNCEICGETKFGTVVHAPRFCLCDECLTMLDAGIAREIIGDEDEDPSFHSDTCTCEHCIQIHSERRSLLDDDAEGWE